MLKLLKALLRSEERPSSSRSLNGPYDLKPGDMLKFEQSYALPEGVRGETYRVQKVATYFYADEPCPQFVIKGGKGERLFLTIEDFDGEELLVISRKLKRKEVEDLVGWGNLKKSLGDVTSSSLAITGDALASEWSADGYQKQVDGAEGRYFEQDLRGAAIPSSGGEAFRYHEYFSADETKLLEVEVWDGNEYEVCLGVVRPFSDVAEYWPAAV